MKADRKYLAHYIDAAFDMTYKATEYARLGKDLEELAIELNPDVETKKNILGENTVTHNGYEVSADADPYYYEYDDALSQKILDIALGRLSGDECKTSYVDVVLKPGESDDAAPTVLQAWREDVVVVPNSYGGDTSGVQVPFTVNFAGNRTKGTFDLTTKKFTAASSGL
jgi:hypothetical protein